MHKKITISGREFDYILERKPVKNINIRIKPDGKIYVSANKRISEKYIMELVSEKSEFILNSIERIEKREKEKQNNDSKTIRYLGDEYALQIIQSEDERVDFDDVLKLFTQDIFDIERRNFLIKQWQFAQCIEVFARLNEEAYQAFSKKYSVPFARITVKDMKSRWGSCSMKTKRISMSARLIEYPVECIKAVFFHEYAHFVQANHSAKFYAVLEEMMPDYKKWDRVLKRR